MGATAWRLADVKPDPNVQALADGCQRDTTKIYTGFAPNWVYVNDRDFPASGPPPAPRWVRGVVHSGPQRLLASRIASSDDPITHHSFDTNIDVQVDRPDDFLTGASRDGTPESGTIHLERESDWYPAWARPQAGDRIEALGSWVWDCDHYRPNGEKTEFHPFRAAWVTRHPGGPSPTSARGEAEADLFVSTDATPAGTAAECAHQTKGSDAVQVVLARRGPVAVGERDVRVHGVRAAACPARRASRVARRRPRQRRCAARLGHRRHRRAAWRCGSWSMRRRASASSSPSRSTSAGRRRRRSCTSVCTSTGCSSGARWIPSCPPDKPACPRGERVDAARADRDRARASGSCTGASTASGARWPGTLLAQRRVDVPRLAVGRLLRPARRTVDARHARARVRLRCAAGLGRPGQADGAVPAHERGRQLDGRRLPRRDHGHVHAGGALGRHVANASTAGSTCPPSNMHGCYQLTYTVSRVRLTGEGRTHGEATRSTQLASLGEEVLGKASQNPTALAVPPGRDAAEGPRRRPLEARPRARADGEAHRAAREAPREARGRRRSKPAAASKTTPAKPDAAKPTTPRRKRPPRARARGARPARPRRSPASFRPARPRPRSAGARPRRPRRARERSTSTFGWRDVLALVDLRRRRQEVDLADVADQHDVEERRRPAARRVRASCRRRARRRSRRRRRACARGARRRRAHRHLGVLPLEEHARQRVEERRLAAERLRHPVRALGDGAAHPDRADVREPALGVLAAPRAVADAPGVDRARRSRRARRRTASSNFVGIPYVRPKSMPVPSGIVARSTSRPAIPFTTSFSVPSPPTATTSVAPPSTALRARARSGGPAARRRASRRSGRAARRGARARASACPSRRCRTPG